MINKIKEFFNTKKEKKENYNKDQEENFEIQFEENINLEEIKKRILENEDKYKPKKERPHYWTEKIDTSILNKKEEKKDEEIIIDVKPEPIKKTKKDYYKKKKEWIKKGKKYEKFVGEYFEKLGYIIKFNGIEKEKKDNSIDIIAIKKDEILLIQCKNWKENGKYKLTHKDIKAFIGDTHTFINENPQYKEYNIKRLFVISGKILDKSAYAYIKEHQNIINYLLLKIEE